MFKKSCPSLSCPLHKSNSLPQLKEEEEDHTLDLCPGSDSGSSLPHGYLGELSAFIVLM